MKAYINTLIYEVKFKHNQGDPLWKYVKYITAGTIRGFGNENKIIYIEKRNKSKTYNLTYDINHNDIKQRLNVLFEYTGKTFTLEKFKAEHTIVKDIKIIKDY